MFIISVVSITLRLIQFSYKYKVTLTAVQFIKPTLQSVHVSLV